VVFKHFSSATDATSSWTLISRNNTAFSQAVVTRVTGIQVATFTRLSFLLCITPHVSILGVSPQCMAANYSTLSAVFFLFIIIESLLFNI